ncbi:MAG: hypothetical protein R2762_30945 [Bryobacteraceae bacterium]
MASETLRHCVSKRVETIRLYTRRSLKLGEGLIRPAHEAAIPKPTPTSPVCCTRFRQTRSSPGVIIVSQDLDIGADIEDLLLIWAATNAEDWTGRIGFVPV